MSGIPLFRAASLGTCAGTKSSLLSDIQWQWQWAPCNVHLAMLLLVVYLIVVALLRFERTRRMHRRFAYKTRGSFAAMTTDDAHAILMYLAEKEFPLMFATAIQFALFKTYGIPSISELLVLTGQLSNEKLTSRRAADTQALLFEFAFNSPTSDRTLTAIARMNYLHSSYQKSKRITNNDLLYTLSLFALEPKRWVDKYEWRSFTDMEVCAIGTFWKSLGDAMAISYGVLPSQHWKDGVQWFEELQEWSIRYEAQHLVPAVTNHKVASSTISIFLWKLPRKFKVVGRYMITVLLGDKLMEAIMFETPPRWYYVLVPIIMHLRRLTLRYLCLPRFTYRPLTGTLNSRVGRYWAKDYLAHPWYVRPTLARRWGPMAWLDWIIGCPLPGDEGETYIPQGYDPTEVGPDALKGKGTVFMAEWKKKLRLNNRGGCPFH